MGTDLISSGPFIPPEARTVNNVIKYGLMGGAALVGLYAFVAIGPTMVMATAFIDSILSNTLLAVGYGVGILASLFVARETFSTGGSINNLIRLPYWSVINGLTRMAISVDPMSPIDTALKRAQDDEQQFETQFEELDGITDSLRDKAADYRKQAADAQHEGVAAKQQGKMELFQLRVDDYAQFSQAASEYEAAYNRLLSTRDLFKQISQACNYTIQKLTRDRNILADKWKTQQAVSKAQTAASRLLGRKGKDATWSQAQQAKDLINTKYSVEFGHLDHLKRYAQPFLESIDVQRGSYSEEMLAGIQDSGTALIQTTAATPLPLPMPGLGQQQPSASSFL